MIDKQTATHFPWGDNCDGWHLVQRPALSVIEERMPPGTIEDRHYHERAHQFFYVLEGTLSMEIEGREFVLEAGQGVEAGAGARHHVSNASKADVRFLVISNPTPVGDRIVVNTPV